MKENEKLEVSPEPSCFVIKEVPFRTVLTENNDQKRTENKITQNKDVFVRNKIIAMVHNLRINPRVFMTTLVKSPESKSSEVELATRKYFIKVLTIVLILDTLTVLFSTLSLFILSIGDFFISASGVMLTITALIAYILLDQTLVYSKSLRKSPFSWLGLCSSFFCYNIIIMFCTAFWATTALICILWSNAMFVMTCLFLARYTKYDFKGLSLYGIALMVSLLTLPISYFGSRALDYPLWDVFLIVFVTFSVIFCIWIANDIHLILKEKVIPLDLKEFALPSLILYTSLCSLFLLTLAMKKSSDLLSKSFKHKNVEKGCDKS